jgi:hypothetical protein
LNKRLGLAQAAVAVASVLALTLKWHSVQDFVRAVDHSDGLFIDFAAHYYPTVHDSLRQGAPAGGFFYPVAFAALLSPLALFSLPVAKVLWGGVLAGSIYAIAFPLVRAAAGDRPALALAGTAITMTSIPVLHDLKWGQVSLPIVACAASALVLHARGRRWAPPVLLAIATGIKGYPLVFASWLVARRDVPAVIRTAIACFATCIVLPALVLGPMHALFVQRVSTSSVLGAADGVLRDFNSQYGPAVLARYHGGWDDAAVATKSWGLVGSFGVVALIAVLLIVVGRSTAPRIAERRALLGFVLLAASVPFWIRTSWAHYFVHLPLAQVLLAGMLVETRRMRDRLALFLFVAPSVYLSSVLALFASEGWWYYANAGSLFFANLLVLCATTLVIVDAHAEEVQRYRTRGVVEPVAR